MGVLLWGSPLSFQTLRFLSILSHSFLSIKSGMGAMTVSKFVGEETQDEVMRMNGMEVVDMQTDLFDNGLIRMKSDEPDEQTFEQIM